MHPGRLFTRLTRLRLKLVRGVSLASLWQVLLARADSRRSADRASCCCNQRGPSTSDKSSVLGSVANRNHPLGGFLFALRGQAFLRLSAPTLDASSFGSLPGLCRAGAGNLLSVFCSRAIVDSLALRHPFHTLGNAHSHDAAAPANERTGHNRLAVGVGLCPGRCRGPHRLSVFFLCLLPLGSRRPADGPQAYSSAVVSRCGACSGLSDPCGDSILSARFAVFSEEWLAFFSWLALLKASFLSLPLHLAPGRHGRTSSGARLICLPLLSPLRGIAPKSPFALQLSRAFAPSSFLRRCRFSYRCWFFSWVGASRRSRLPSRG